MKAEILSLLRERDDYVSGQEICGRFGVSRTAVWKAVNQLKNEGYLIEAVKNRGYLLKDNIGIYGKNELLSRIHTKWVGRNLLYYDSLTSTNNQAKIEAEGAAPHGTLIVADMQTAGRGRRGRGWESPSGTNIYCSLILKPSFPPSQASMVTLVMAHSVARAIQEVACVEAKIKWPNDVVVNKKKVCGILTEMSAEPDYINHVVIGVGINVGEQEFPPEIHDKATCLNYESGRQLSRGTIIARLMECFEEDYGLFLQYGNMKGLMPTYNQMLVNCDAQVWVLDPSGEFGGKAKGIAETGELLVEIEDGGIVPISSGEVSVRGIYGYV